MDPGIFTSQGPSTQQGAARSIPRARNKRLLTFGSFSKLEGSEQEMGFRAGQVIDNSAKFHGAEGSSGKGVAWLLFWPRRTSRSLRFINCHKDSGPWGEGSWRRSSFSAI